MSEELEVERDDIRDNGRRPPRSRGVAPDRGGNVRSGL